MEGLERAARAKAASIEVLETLARAYVELGRYEEVAPVAARLSQKGRKGKLAAAIVLGLNETLTGKYAAAKKRLRRAIRANPRAWEARVLLAEAEVATGKHFEQLPEADAIADFYQEGKLKGAAALTLLARALHLTQYFHNSNEIFMEAAEADPDHLPVHLYRAMLFMEKEDEGSADKDLQEVLRRNPNHPVALALMAFIDMSSDNDAPKAIERVNKALKVNPRLVLAHQVHAHILIETEQFEQAIATLSGALVTNPSDPKTLSMLAACHLLLEDEAQFRALMKRALKVNKRFAEGYHLAAEYASHQHRYRDAIELEKKAIEVNPGYWPAYVGLGVGYSRIGNDEKANELLQEAFENDRFNVRAYNMTAGFYDGPAKQMKWRKMGPFKVRLVERDVEILGPVLGPFLEEAYATHKKKYAFSPKKPLHIELFGDRATFSVRTVGYPMMGAHGVCFGHVVTSLSPRRGDFNWGMVLWHELAHVWHIQMAKSRVPRWFTEGLAEHETTLRRPEWKREMDAELWAAHKAGRLKGVARFNTMFTQAKSMGEIVLAYYYASKVVAFIDKTWGFDVFPKMLRAWGQKKKTDQVFQEVLGIDLATFDARVKGYLEGDLLARFATAYEPPEKDSKDPIAQAYRDGLAALRTERWPEAAKAFDLVLGAGKDSSDLRVLRALAAMGAEDWKVAREHLEKALTLDPQSADAYGRLRKVLEELDDKDAQYELLKRALVHQEHALPLVLEVGELARKRGNKADLQEMAERGMHIAPFAVPVRVLRGQALLGAGKPAAALEEAEQALVLMGQGLQEPDRRRAPDSDAVNPRLAAKLLKAEALIALGKKKRARKVLEGLSKSPEGQQTPRIKELLEQL